MWKQLFLEPYVLPSELLCDDVALLFPCGRFPEEAKFVGVEKSHSDQNSDTFFRETIHQGSVGDARIDQQSIPAQHVTKSSLESYQ